MADFTAINDVFRQTDREVWLLTAQSGAERAGLIATFVNQASIIPALPRVVVGLAKQHHTMQVVERGRGFVLHLLAEDQLELVWRFGLQSGRTVDKWAGLSSTDAVGGPRLTGALAWLDCRVEGGARHRRSHGVRRRGAGGPDRAAGNAVDATSADPARLAGAAARAKRGPTARCRGGCRRDSGVVANYVA